MSMSAVTPVDDYLRRRDYHFSKKGQLDQILIDSVYETTETHIASFILAIMHQGVFSVTSLVIAIIYLSRFKEATRVSLHTYTWRLLFLTALLIADKANEDKPIKNGSLVKLFPIVTMEELNSLEAIMLTKIKFGIFIKSDLFCSFVDKLLNESVSLEINSIVINSDFAIQQLIPSMRTVPCTPEPIPPALEFLSTKTANRRPEMILLTASSSRRRSTAPKVLIQNLMDSTNCAMESPRIRPFSYLDAPGSHSRGRSPSISHKRSPSTSFVDENSLEYSRSSSRRLSGGLPLTVPPPPIFEPVKYQGHPRRFSVSRITHDSSPDPAPSATKHLHSHVRTQSPGARSLVALTPGNRSCTSDRRWNTRF